MFHDIEDYENESSNIQPSESSPANKPREVPEPDDEEKVDSDLEDIFMDAIGEM